MGATLLAGLGQSSYLHPSVEKMLSVTRGPAQRNISYTFLNILSSYFTLIRCKATKSDVLRSLVGARLDLSRKKINVFFFLESQMIHLIQYKAF